MREITPGQAFMPIKDVVDNKGTSEEEFREQFFEKGSEIFSQGEKPRFIVYINSGTMKVYNKDEDGKTHLVHILRKGDFYGLLAVLMNNPYISTGIAESDCHLTLIRSESFDAFVLKNPAVGLKMIKFMAFKLGSTDIELILWPKQRFDKFLVVHIDDELLIRQLIRKSFGNEEFRLKQYSSIEELRNDLITLVRLARKYQGFFLITDGELEDGTFCDVLTTLENIMRLDKSVVSILTGKVDSSTEAEGLVAKFNTTHVVPDIVISKVDTPKVKKIDSLLTEIFYNKYHLASNHNKPLSSA